VGSASLVKLLRYAGFDVARTMHTRMVVLYCDTVPHWQPVERPQKRSGIRSTVMLAVADDSPSFQWKSEGRRGA